MVFSSYIFIAVFLPAVLVIYYLLSRLRSSVWQKLFLVIASLFFYGYYNVSYLALIIASMLINYAAAACMQRRGNHVRRKLLLTAGVLFNVLLIGYFKYRDFFVENINALFRADFVLRNIALPLGISFFTFQQLSFLISIYKREEQMENLLDYSLFVSFFPQLVAGPIVLYSEMIPQFRDEKRRRFNMESFAAGIYIFAIGLFKKAVIADTLNLFVGNGFGAEYLKMGPAWAAALSYTMQIYFDFSGYSDMAIGLGKMFNIDLPANFNSPYKSVSITEFWRRWHMTLGRALSAYVYKPLGGNRRGILRTCINLFLTFTISGLWHGAAWNFVLWGTLHGVMMIFERLCGKLLNKIPEWIRIAATFVVVNFLWVLFRAESFAQALMVWCGMFAFPHTGFYGIAKLAADGLTYMPPLEGSLYVLALLGICMLIVFRAKNGAEKLRNFRPTMRSAAAAALMFASSMLCLARESVFIYFNF